MHCPPFWDFIDQITPKLQWKLSVAEWFDVPWLDMGLYQGLLARKKLLQKWKPSGNRRESLTQHRCAFFDSPTGTCKETSQHLNQPQTLCIMHVLGAKTQGAGNLQNILDLLQKYSLICIPLKTSSLGLPCWSSERESACQCRGCGFNPLSGKVPHATEQLSPRSRAQEPQLLSRHAASTEAHVPVTSALRQDKSLQWEAHAQ